MSPFRFDICYSLTHFTAECLLLFYHKQLATARSKNPVEYSSNQKSSYKNNCPSYNWDLCFKGRERCTLFPFVQSTLVSQTGHTFVSNQKS